jgi:two-component system, oxyanion-binding sensor
VAAGLGRIIAAKLDLWPNSPEKVLGVRQDWAEKNRDLLMALMQAVLKAAAWLDDPAHSIEAAAVLCRAEYVGAPEDILRRTLTGRLVRVPGGREDRQPDFIVFHRHHANFPWLSHALWLLTQMRRWGQIASPLNLEEAARQVYRPDLYRHAAALAHVEAPADDTRVETGLFGGQIFDPARPEDYVAGFSIHS